MRRRSYQYQLFWKASGASQRRLFFSFLFRGWTASTVQIIIHQYTDIPVLYHWTNASVMHSFGLSHGMADAKPSELNVLCHTYTSNFCGNRESPHSHFLKHCKPSVQKPSKSGLNLQPVCTVGLQGWIGSHSCGTTPGQDCMWCLCAFSLGCFG